MVQVMRTFDPGTSPFHAKGTLWMGVREFIELRVNGGAAAVADRLNAMTKAFFLEKFLPAGWYDILPITQVTRAVADTLGVSETEYLRQSAVWQAERDLKGAYAPVLNVDTPQEVCHRFASIYALMYDFGRAEVVSEQTGQVRACCHGMPGSIAEWWTRASGYYTELVLRAAGARNARILWASPEPDGERWAVPLVKISSTTEWD